MRHYILPLTAFVLAGFIACGNRTQSKDTDAEDKKIVVKAPEFNADSAYRYVAEQVAFGPRVPNTDAHRKCGDYLAGKLAQLGAKVYVQDMDLASYEGKLLKCRNIIGAYNPEAKKRIALFAHWDSRPWADNDPDKANHYKPVPGANDGASGVGVLLEIARQLQQQPTALGIDLILLDAEDGGTHQEYTGNHQTESWCLGAQYWGRNPHVANYNARFGILLDMVGGKGATFYYEEYSESFARSLNRKVWKTAKELGFEGTFVKERGGMITDDHVFVNQLTHIPTIDIVAFDTQNTFFPYWHTLKDDMDCIDAATLKAVGQTVMQVIYNEK